MQVVVLDDDGMVVFKHTVGEEDSAQDQWPDAAIAEEVLTAVDEAAAVLDLYRAEQR